MFLKIIGIIGILAVCGGLGLTIPTTIQLAKIDTSLNRSLRSTEQLVAVQQAVVQKNKNLDQVLTLTKQLNASLLPTVTTTSQLEKNIADIDELNQVTLHTNDEMKSSSSISGQNLGDIADYMQSLLRSINTLATSVHSLNQVVASDQTNLDQMRTATAQMDQKVPGVAG
ncbi:hypothetical protein [Sulfoacidibacillus ferrooxidans]|uniref:Uncharacterized protein n=1 Tax=Sulfoacidibacillus ferrooxidans TaxID=2005001 RepID=A0A9X2ACH2_9BACL|nr:hypothetical protein [Sulfoacidibacillus ferrooxidans]MCI0183774.1 hypothetical protein [Sulfoacidibacillus ferrooxidans]